MEEVVEEKEKLKTFDLNQTELETLREQMKEKIHIQTKLRTEIEILRIENNRLKALSNNNTRSNSKNRISTFSPRAKDFNYQALNTISNFHTPNVSSPVRTKKEIKSILIKRDKKDKKEYRDFNTFRSPQSTQINNTNNKMIDFNFEDNNKKKVELDQKEKSKTLKNLLSYSSSGIFTVPNRKNVHFPRNLTNKKIKNNDITMNKKNKNGITKKKEKKKAEKLLNKTMSNFNKKNTFSKNLVSSQCIINKDKEKENDYSSLSFSSENNDVTNNNDKSKITTEDYEEEQAIIDEEIREMNDIEDDILSLLDQIKEFKQENNNLT
jgi:hypothetical protein